MHATLFFKKKLNFVKSTRVLLSSMEFTNTTHCQAESSRKVLVGTITMISLFDSFVLQVAIELPYALLQAILYGLVTYSMMGYHWSADKFFWYLFASLCTFLYFTYYGMLAVSISPNAQVAGIIGSAFYSIFNLFSGFLIPKPVS